MSALIEKLWNDECGFVVSAELALVSTVGVLGLTAGLTQAAGSVHGELNDFGASMRSMKQPHTQVAQSDVAFGFDSNFSR